MTGPPLPNPSSTRHGRSRDVRREEGIAGRTEGLGHLPGLDRMVQLYFYHRRTDYRRTGPCVGSRGDESKDMSSGFISEGQGVLFFSRCLVYSASFRHCSSVLFATSIIEHFFSLSSLVVYIFLVVVFGRGPLVFPSYSLPLHTYLSLISFLFYASSCP